MGRRRRERMLKKLPSERRQSCVHETNSEFDAELAELGLPLAFSSTKGQHIEGQPNVEAARVGQIRRFQQFQGKKLKEWQIKRLKGVKLRQAREKRAKK